MTRVLFFMLLMLCQASCLNYFMPNPPCPPPPSARMPVTDTYSCDSATVPPCSPPQFDPLPLYELVDIALQNSPRTRAAWYRAKAAATQVGTARGAYLPPVVFTATWLQSRISAVNLDLIALNQQRNVSFGFMTSYLLYDFGGRNGRLCAALAALAEANWLYNWDVQTVILNVAQSYYNYVNARGVYEANLDNVENFSLTTDVARALREIGIQGMADQLQAETQLYQAKIALEESKLALDIAYATLANALGLPPDTKMEIASLPDQLEVNGICDDIAYLMTIAKNHRADLMASRAFVVESREKIRIARSDFLPNITTNLVGNRTSLNDLNFNQNFQIEFNINVPLFSSFHDINDLRKAQAELLAAQANLDDEELKAYLEVVSDYFEFLANVTILNHSCNYLQISKLNQQVAFANYKAGITSIVNLMIANQALVTARIQLVDAKTNFLTALANLAYDTGGLSYETVTARQTISPCLVETEEIIDVVESCPIDLDSDDWMHETP